MYFHTKCSFKLFELCSELHEKETHFFQIIFISLCVFGGIRLCCIFGALERIPMALVHTLLNGAPVLVRHSFSNKLACLYENVNYFLELNTRWVYNSLVHRKVKSNTFTSLVRLCTCVVKLESNLWNFLDKLCTLHDLSTWHKTVK